MGQAEPPARRALACWRIDALVALAAAGSASSWVGTTPTTLVSGWPSLGLTSDGDPDRLIEEKIRCLLR